MSNASDFIIENGVLKEYIGRGGNVIIPEGVTSIGYGVFWECSSLTSVVIPEGVTSIEYSAFRNCSSLTSVVIPESVTSIGAHAFSWCSSLTSVVISEGVTSIGDSAFEGCSSLTSVVIPEGVTSIGYRAFYGCSALTSVVIPKGVTYIQTQAFSDCSALTSVVIPEGVKSISKSAFKGCSGLADEKGFVIVRGVIYGYYGPGGNVVIPENVTAIGDSAFKGCSSLTSVVIPEGVTSIGYGAFADCSSLTSVVIPEGVTSIGESAFANCVNLKSITISDSVTDIAYHVFDGCDSLRKIYASYRAKLNLSTKIIPQLIIDDIGSLVNVFLYQTGDTWTNHLIKQLNADNTMQFWRLLMETLPATGKVETAVANRLISVTASISPYLNKEQITQALDWLKSKPKLHQKMAENPSVVAALSEDTEETGQFDEVNHIIDNYCKSVHLHELAQNTGVLPIRFKNANKVCPEMATRIILSEYINLWDKYKKNFTGEISSFDQLILPEMPVFSTIADELAAKMDQSQLSDYLERFLSTPNYRPYVLAYGRVATEESLSRIIPLVVKRQKGRAKEMYWANNLDQALYYSDNKLAIEYIEKYGDIAKYTRMRGMSVQGFRDRFNLPDFGFDASGVRRFVTGESEIEARISLDMQVLLCDAQGKLMKSISKKTNEEKIVAEEVAILKKNVKEFYKKRLEYLKATYLSAEKIEESIWRDIYISNPLFKPLVEAAIWRDSAGVFFEVTDKVAETVDGAPYLPVGEVALAHGFDMSVEEIEAWQKRIVKLNKRLLIEQVWEPIFDFESIPDICTSFQNCYLGKKERNECKQRLADKGIKVESAPQERRFDVDAGKYIFSNSNVMFLGSVATLYYTVSEQDGDIIIDRLIVKRGPSDRELNTVLLELGRSVVKSRIINDDTVHLTENILSSFGLAQIQEFLEFSLRCGSANCTALFLNYKNSNFIDFACMDEFIL